MDTIVLNTEAHIFPRSKLIRGLKTGWERKPRDKDGKVTRERKRYGEKEKVTESKASGAEKKGDGEETRDAEGKGKEEGKEGGVS